MWNPAITHLRAGTITAKERRYLLFVCPAKYYNLLRVATVSG
jgi:hypothetical protein